MKDIEGTHPNILNKRETILEENDPKRLERICEYVRGKWSVARQLKHFTMHDDRHSEKVEEKLYEIIPDKYLVVS